MRSKLPPRRRSRKAARIERPTVRLLPRGSSSRGPLARRTAVAGRANDEKRTLSTKPSSRRTPVRMSSRRRRGAGAALLDRRGQIGACASSDAGPSPSYTPARNDRGVGRRYFPGPGFLWFRAGRPRVPEAIRGHARERGQALRPSRSTPGRRRPRGRLGVAFLRAGPREPPGRPAALHPALAPRAVCRSARVRPTRPWHVQQRVRAGVSRCPAAHQASRTRHRRRERARAPLRFARARRRAIATRPPCP